MSAGDNGYKLRGDRPHQFVNAGIDGLRMVNIHAAGKIETEWLDE